MIGYSFTNGVRSVLQRAREEAARLGHRYVGTEHILLGMIRAGEGVAMSVLTALKVDLDALRQEIEQTAKPPGITERAAIAADTDLPYTTRAKKVLELAMHEAHELNYRYIDTGILLLGLLREKKGIAALALTKAGVTLERARAETRGLSESESEAGWEEPPASRARGYNFTDRVRKILQMAREEAARLHHDQVETEHILLGLIREGEGVAAAVLTNLNVEFEDIEQMIEGKVVRGTAARAAHELPYTRGAKRVLELSMSEARELDHEYVGSEHLLLGLLREEKGIAAEVLTDMGVTLEEARAETLRLLGTELPSGPVPGRRAEILAQMRALVVELLGTPAPDAARLSTIAHQLTRLLDELAGSGGAGGEATR